MKTEKEIEERISIHQDRSAKLMELLVEERMKIFPNKGVVLSLRKQMDEENMAIVYLSWVLI